MSLLGIRDGHTSLIAAEVNAVFGNRALALLSTERTPKKTHAQCDGSNQESELYT
jgi:hypothetical protein